MSGYAVAASGEVRGPDGVRGPAGDAHAWHPGQNQTRCGIPLARAGLRRFPHVPWDFRDSDVVGPGDELRHLCERCLAAGRPRGRERRPWTRVSPRL